MYQFQGSSGHLVVELYCVYSVQLNLESCILFNCTIYTRCIYHCYNNVRYYKYYLPVLPHCRLLGRQQNGRYKVGVFSLWLLLFLYIFFTIFISLVTTALVGLFNITVLVLALFLLIISVSLLFISIGCFDANIIQFGVDQLYEFPVEDQSLFTGPSGLQTSPLFFPS